ncbi:MAG: 30S ribosomal protein S20 [Pseudomonadota bacterium]|nr:30S ribosomal protein S20 [Pseudomonadota bacterium]
MANSPQARKRARQAIGRRARNVARRSAVRTHIKKFMTLSDAGETENADKAYRSAVSQIDRATRKGLTHRNKAARLKRQLSAKRKAATAQ